MGEHLLCKQGVVGSIPTSSTYTLYQKDAGEKHPLDFLRDLLMAKRSPNGLTVEYLKLFHSVFYYYKWILV